jgi:hypothetical protein
LFIILSNTNVHHLAPCVVMLKTAPVSVFVAPGPWGMGPVWQDAHGIATPRAIYFREGGRLILRSGSDTRKPSGPLVLGLVLYTILAYPLGLWSWWVGLVLYTDPSYPLDPVGSSPPSGLGWFNHRSFLPLDWIRTPPRWVTFRPPERAQNQELVHKRDRMQGEHVSIAIRIPHGCVIPLPWRGWQRQRYSRLDSDVLLVAAIMRARVLRNSLHQNRFHTWTHDHHHAGGPTELSPRPEKVKANRIQYRSKILAQDPSS